MVTGAHVDLSDESGTTALMFNDVQVMTYLMKAGADDAILNFFSVHSNPSKLVLVELRPKLEHF